MIKLVRYSAKTHQGPYLQVNEDRQSIDIINNLYMALDGIGGAGIGDQCAKSSSEAINKAYIRFGDNPESTLPFFFSPKYLVEGNALINALYFAHSVIKKQNDKKEMNNRGGCSCIAAALAENIVTFVSTGNCVALLYRKGKLKTICHPDSLDIIHHKSSYSSLRTCPLSGIGLFKDIHFTVRELKVEPEDLILMMTDGAYCRIKNNELQKILEEKESQFHELNDAIFSLSNSRGNLDNQTAILLKF